MRRAEAERSAQAAVDRQQSSQFSPAGTSSDEHALVGEWHLELRGCETPSVRLTLEADGSGEVWYRDCNGAMGCESGSLTHFDWRANGSSSGDLTLSYTQMEICGQEQPTPDGGTLDYEVTASTLRYADREWERMR